jgi:hypothetical protein
MTSIRCSPIRRLPVRWLRPALLATAALLVSAYPALLEAQGRGPQGRPGFPPGLHDRTLPPGKPFAGGQFDPPARQRGQAQSAAQLAALLDRLLAEPGFPDDGLLVQAVDAFNLWVMALDLHELANPPAPFLVAHARLSDALGIRRLAQAERYDEQDSGFDELRREYFLPGGSIPLPRTRAWTTPGMSAANPSGFGAEFGSVWAGASYQPRARYSTGQTGAAAVGFGLGDASRYVGLQVGINSFSTVSSGFGNRMGVDLHLHRTFGGVWGVAVGWESVAAPYSVTRDSGENQYVVGSRWLQFRDNPDAPFGLGMLSLGIGTGRYQSEADFHADAGRVGLFGSFGVRLAAPVSLVAEWTGQDLMLATSVTPLRNHDLAITAGFTEITGTAGDGARFTVGGSLGLNLR